jgi:hypothetical protein
MAKEKQPTLEWMENYTGDDAGEEEFDWDYLLEELTTLLKRISKQRINKQKRNLSVTKKSFIMLLLMQKQY